MSALKSGSTLRSLVLTPERIPSFFIPSRSPLLSPCFRGNSSERTRLLSDHDDPPEESSPDTPASLVTDHQMFFMGPLRRIKRPRRANAVGAELETADTDETTRAAMSLPHVPKVTTPYGFRAVLAATPSTSRRESLFHRNKLLKVTVTDADQEDTPETSPIRPDPNKSRVSLRPVKALGLQVMKELKKPAAALKALSPSHRCNAAR